MSWVRRALDAPREDRGSALVLVIGSMFVLSLFVGVSMTYAVRTLHTSSDARDSKQALAAAEAGVDDYLARLNRDDAYWLHADCANTALKGPATSGGAACGWGSSTAPGWLTVPGSDTGAQFHYDVSTTSTRVDGRIELTTTGRSGDAYRTTQVVLRRGGFGEFLYYTVYETISPANEAVYGINNASAQDKCSHYYWEPVTATSKPRDASCRDLSFITGDKINGPLHTNDTMLMSGAPRFSGTTTTSTPACRPVNGVTPPATSCYRKATGSTAPVFSKGIAYRPEVELPSTGGDLNVHVDPVQTSRPGCLYTGPTRIRLNSNGDMQVWSPHSTSVNPGCGAPGTDSDQLGSPLGATVRLPAETPLVMVRHVPATQATPTSASCPTGSIGGYPQANDYNLTFAEMGCRLGTLYLEGTLKGRLTISAENNILITGNVTYAGGTNGTDVLGLIAQNSVEIYHPVQRGNCTQTSNGTCTAYAYSNLAGLNGSVLTNVTIQASVLTLQHSFGVQSYSLGGQLGTITVYGSIAQRYRGPVGTSGGSGYLKNYNYDTRLRYAPPPFFLDPVRSSWGQKTFVEVRALYDD
jgi:Tfp pilus assembly protein PilX